MNKISKNQIALAGEFAVLSQLAMHGFDANLTLGNTKSVDILVSYPATGSMRRLEVKTTSNLRTYENKVCGKVEGQWRMGEKHESITDKNLYYCFVGMTNHNSSFKFYVVPNRVVANFVTRSHQYWLDSKSTRRDNPMRLFQIGKSKKENSVQLPLASKYENNWDLLK